MRLFQLLFEEVVTDVQARVLATATLIMRRATVVFVYLTIAGVSFLLGLQFAATGLFLTIANYTALATAAFWTAGTLAVIGLIFLLLGLLISRTR